MAWNILKSLESYLGVSPQQKKADDHALVDELSVAIDRLKNVTRQIEDEQSSLSEHRIKELREDKLKGAIEKAHAQMRSAVLQCHAELGTGVDEITLNELHVFYKTFEEKMIDGAHSSLRQTIQCSIASFFHRELGPVSWQQLQEMLDARQLKWPEPEGLSPSVTPEEIEIARENNRTRDELSFLQMPMSQTADILVGIVKIWQASYPLPSSSLYRETIYQSVASALRVQLVEKAVSLTLERSDTLVDEIESVLAKELELVRKALSKHTLTLEEAYHANQVTSQACSRIIPQLVWCKIHDQLVPNTSKCPQ